jgi:hypothetical protein
MLLAEKTVKYKTYLKHAIVEGLRPVFANHPDPLLTPTKVTLEFPNTKEKYPAILVRFNESQIYNAGVGHIEFLSVDGLTGKFKFKHYFYKGNVVFNIYALSSLDRDLISDTLVQTLGMSDLMSYTRNFSDRVYFPDLTAYPDATWNFVNYNADVIGGGSEGQLPAPWGPEDVLVYTTNYSVPVFGEFYSVPPDTSLQSIESVTVYPYIGGLESVPTGADDPGVWE